MRAAVDYVNRYFANHGTLTELAEILRRRADRGRGDGGFRRYNALQGVNCALADSSLRRGTRFSTTRATPTAICSTRWARRRCSPARRRRFRRLRASCRPYPRGETFPDAGGSFPAQTGRRRLRGRRGRSAGAGRRTRFAARRCGAARIHRLPPAEGRSRRALLPDYDSVALLVEAGVLLPESHSRVPGLACQRHDLPHPARNVQHLPRRRSFRAVRSSTINDEGKWCYYAGGFATLAGPRRRRRC